MCGLAQASCPLRYGMGCYADVHYNVAHSHHKTPLKIWVRTRSSVPIVSRVFHDDTQVVSCCKRDSRRYVGCRASSHSSHAQWVREVPPGVTSRRCETAVHEPVAETR
jgi:hypothetical protein